MGLFYSSPSKPNFFRIGRGPLPMRPQKIPGKAAPTWSLKMLNRIRVFPQNLALGMKTHISELGDVQGYFSGSCFKISLVRSSSGAGPFCITFIAFCMAEAISLCIKQFV